MQKTGVVKEVCEDGFALVQVIRKSACSGDCSHCGGCASFQQELTVKAVNGIAAKVGDRVLLESDSGAVLGAAVLVYFLPILSFFAGYAFGCLLSWRPGLLGFIGFLLGVGLVVLSEKKLSMKKLQSRIVGLEEL